MNITQESYCDSPVTKKGGFICITTYRLSINITKKWTNHLHHLYYLLTSPKHTYSNLTLTSSPFWVACWCCVTFHFLFSSLSSTMASRVLPVVFLFFFPSRGLFMRLLFFGRPAFLGAAYGEQYLIAASSGVNLNVSISK